MEQHNQRVPTPTAVQQAGYNIQDSTGPRGIAGSTGPTRDGIIFLSEVRDQTGAGKFPAGSATGVYTSDAFFNPYAKGLRIFVSIATGAATGTTTVKLQNQDAFGAWWDVSGAATSALAGNTTGAVLTVRPGIVSGANATVQNHVGLVWRLVATQALAPATFTVSADYLG